MHAGLVDHYIRDNVPNTETVIGTLFLSLLPKSVFGKYRSIEEKGGEESEVSRRPWLRRG